MSSFAFSYKQTLKCYEKLSMGRFMGGVNLESVDCVEIINYIRSMESNMMYSKQEVESLHQWIGQLISAKESYLLSESDLLDKQTSTIYELVERVQELEHELALERDPSMCRGTPSPSPEASDENN